MIESAGGGISPPPESPFGSGTLPKRASGRTTRNARRAAAHRNVTLESLRLLFGLSYLQGFGVRLWDGTTFRSADGLGPARFVLILNDPSALRHALLPPLDLNPGRAFVEDLIDIEGDMEAAIDTFFAASASLSKWRTALLVRLLLGLPCASALTFNTSVSRLNGRAHSRIRDEAAVSFHYDRPASFFRTFLGETLVYSCAYYAEESMSLDKAQEAKIDYILHKLQLAPGERLLDIGCGWGSLAIRAAEHHGARVLGVTLSPTQYKEANRRIQERGLQDRVQVELRDYRDLSREGVFDKIVSVGMFEHVGQRYRDSYFRCAFSALRPGGLFLNHAITNQNLRRGGTRRGDFIDRYVFPDGHLIPVSKGLEASERAGFEIRDVENLREHYTRTLRAWVTNLTNERETIVAQIGRAAYRVWLLYMTASAQGFRAGRLGLVQSLLAKPHGDGRVELPPTRHSLYVAPRRA